MRRSICSILTLCLCLCGCYDTEGYDVPIVTDDGTRSVQLQVTARSLSDLNATRADYYDYEVEGEYMNTLCVFIVDASTGMVEMKFGPDLLINDEEAQTGSLSVWTSSTFDISTGSKVVYAFSNWNYMESTAWNALIEKQVGETITETDLRFTVDDPAGKIDIANRRYIPMSGSTATTIIAGDLNNSTQCVSVGMDRLVGQVRINIQGETGQNASDIPLETLLFAGWADRVPLMADDASSYDDIIYEENKFFDISATLSANETYAIAPFYVNETRKDEGFDVSITTTQYGGTMTYMAQTVRREIERNWIYPLTITLDQYELQLDVTAWATAIDGDERVYTNSDREGDKYTFHLLDVTSRFELSPSLLYKGSEVSNATWTWDYKGTDSASWSDSDGILTVTDLTATEGYEYAFSLTVEWTTVGGTKQTREYEVVVVTFDGTGRPRYE